jgi:hypothetical protein
VVAAQQAGLPPEGPLSHTDDSRSYSADSLFKPHFTGQVEQQAGKHHLAVPPMGGGLLWTSTTFPAPPSITCNIRCWRAAAVR